MRSDREIVMVAVDQNLRALEFAGVELRINREFVSAAVKKIAARRAAAEALRSDREFVLASSEKKGFALRFASDQSRSGREVVLAAVEKDVSALGNCASSPEFLKAA